MGNCGVGFAPGAPRQGGLAHRADGGRRGHPRHGPGRGHDLGLGDLPRVPRRARQPAVRDRHRRPGPPRRRAGLRDGRARRPQRARHRRRHRGHGRHRARRPIEAGALGFSTSRTIAHRAIDGEPVPGTYAAEDELFGIGRAIGAGRRRVFELAPAGIDGTDASPARARDRLDAAPRAPRSSARSRFILLQLDPTPDLWREQMDESRSRAIDDGAQIFAAGRRPALRHAHRLPDPPPVRQAALVSWRWPTCRSTSASRHLREPRSAPRSSPSRTCPTTPAYLWNGLPGLVRAMPENAVRDGRPARTTSRRPTTSVDGIARRAPASSTDEDLSTTCCARGRRPGHVDVPHLQLHLRQPRRHPRAAHRIPGPSLGLGDGGAHCGMICDASLPTYMPHPLGPRPHPGPAAVAGAT